MSQMSAQLSVDFLSETNTTASSIADFPYFRLFSPHSPKTMLNNLKKLKVPISHEKYILAGYNSRSPGIFKPLPPLFENRFTMIDSSKVDYFTIDGIADWFTEDVRIKGKKHYRNESMYDTWKSKGLSLEGLSKEEIKKHADQVWSENKGLGLFRPSWAKTVLEILMGKLHRFNSTPVSILDISAGWGDRLISAIALNANYLGFDPNTELKTGHDNIIATLGDNQRHKIRYEPFETATDLGKHDIVFSSPPFYNLEIYSSDENQSINKYPKFEQWRDEFLITSLRNAWNALNKGGMMAIHLADYTLDQNVKINMVRYMLDKVITFPGAKWVGVIGLKGESGKIWPVWVWRKV